MSVRGAGGGCGAHHRFGRVARAGEFNAEGAAYLSTHSGTVGISTVRVTRIKNCQWLPFVATVSGYHSCQAAVNKQGIREGEGERARGVRRVCVGVRTI